MRTAGRKPRRLAAASNRGPNMRSPIRIDFTPGQNWRDDASNLAEWDVWDRAWRKKLGWRAGLRFWGGTSTPGSRVLISRHWPHLLCWSWSVWVGKRREGFDGPRRFSIGYSRQYRCADIWLFVVYARLSWQNYGHMANVGPRYADAPKIFWKHHLENAEPLGSA